MRSVLSAIVARLADEGLLAPGAPQPGVDLAIDRVTSDSRFVEPGSLFCAVRGVLGDGHTFLADAARAGAAAALVELPDESVRIPQVVVTNGRIAAAFAAAEFFGDPSRDMTLIGVTGTNGKTTTTAILRHLLASRAPAGSIGTLGVVGPDGRTVPGTEGLTTPGPAQVAEELRRLADLGVRSAAMEVSSHALDQNRVDAVTFAAAIFTNLSRDHLDYHGTEASYRAAKLRLIELIRPGGVLVANADDPAWADIGREGVHLVRYGTRGRGEVQAVDIRYRDGGVEWHLHTPSCTAPVRAPLFGTFNVYNALGAAAALWGLGWNSELIAEGLAGMPQIPGRLEAVAGATNPAVLIDFAHTPDALERALAALRPLVEGRLIVVFGAGGDRDAGKRPEMGRVAAEHADLTILTSDNPRHEDPVAILDEIEAGMGDAPRRRITDRRDAIEAALEEAAAGDLVLLAGKGHERYQIWGAEKRPFDERVIVQEILNRKGIAS